MHLADFITQNIEPILVEWEAFAATQFPAASHMTPQILRDHARQILSAVAKDLTTSQTTEEQFEKAQGRAEVVWPASIASGDSFEEAGPRGISSVRAVAPRATDLRGKMRAVGSGHISEPHLVTAKTRARPLPTWRWAQRGVLVGPFKLGVTSRPGYCSPKLLEAIPVNVGLIAAILGLLSLIASDQFGAWNRRKYRSDKAKGQAGAEAFKQNRCRKAWFDRVVFCILVAAAGLSTYSAFADKRNSDTELSVTKSRLSGLEAKFKLMTDQLEANRSRVLQIQSQQQKTKHRLDELTKQTVNAGSRLASLEDGSRSLRSRVSVIERQARGRASRRGARNDARTREQ